MWHSFHVGMLNFLNIFFQSLSTSALNVQPSGCFMGYCDFVRCLRRTNSINLVSINTNRYFDSDSNVCSNNVIIFIIDFRLLNALEKLELELILRSMLTMYDFIQT